MRNYNWQELEFLCWFTNLTKTLCLWSEVAEVGGGTLIRDFRSRIADCKQKMVVIRGRRDQEGSEAFTKARKEFNELLHSHEVYWKQ